MKNQLCEKLGIDYPIFAFTHCRDVVVAVSKAGGIGVLGAVGFSPEQLKEELDWIEEHIGDKPYGVDIVIPQKYEGMGDKSAEEMEAQLEKMIPREHIDFAQKLLADAGVPEWPDGTKSMGLMGWTEATATPLLEEALTRPGCKMIANALGTPPADKIKMVHDSGRLIGALCGKVKQAVAHKEAGLDFVVGQGGEGHLEVTDENLRPRDVWLSYQKAPGQHTFESVRFTSMSSPFHHSFQCGKFGLLS